MSTIKKEVFLNRLNIFGVRFINTTLSNTINIIEQNIKNKKKSYMYFINADTLNQVYTRSSLKRILMKTPYVFPDGSGVRLAANIMKRPVKENINGTDLFPHICEMAQREDMTIFLYGAKPGVAATMKEKVSIKYPKLKIVGTLDGYSLLDNEIVNNINYSNADIVLVAKGAPIQEEWIDKHGPQINSSIIMGVGGLFDFYSESIPRAPMFMRKLGIEWVFRLMQEPTRMFSRYIIGNPLFLYRIYTWNKAAHSRHFIKENKFAKVLSTLFYKITYAWHKSYLPIKRAMDIVVSSIALILLSPLLILVALLIKKESRGNVFFKQKRVGQYGKLFNMYKFRSMVANAEDIKGELAIENESNDGVIFKMKNDPRITKVGAFIRKWSIDELPQLLNVLKGNMSLVGPRPPVPSEVSEYVNDDLKRLHTIPGITCIWQVSGRSDIPFKQQVDLDKKYISTCSLVTDIKILFATIPAVLLKKGAY